MPRFQFPSTTNGLAPLGQLSGVDWVLGGTNLHQDIHFSTFYLRASLDVTTRDDYPGYTHIVSIYGDGLERYFIAKDEAHRTADFLIRRCLREPEWLQRQLKAIEVQSEQLSCAFADRVTAKSLRDSSLDELLALYEGHNQYHRALYRVARIPEALDRGVSHFSNYLKGHLRVLGVGDADLPYVFEDLTRPASPSVIASEEKEFANIVAAVLTDRHAALQAHTPLMFLTSSARESLRLHRDKWGWLSYHGYRDRRLRNEEDDLTRLRAAAAAVGEVPRRSDQRRAPAVDMLHRRLDRVHRELFRLYPEIGRVKLFRRYWQLRNFYFLDLLVAEFAFRLDVCEWDIRCCMPEELIAAARTGHLPPSIRDRRQDCTIVYSAKGEDVFCGDDARQLAHAAAICSRGGSQVGDLHGTPACVGTAHGTARVIDQHMTRHSTFRPGDILVCEAADPDFLPMIRQAAAVVTQQGGVTSHASVLCRELGVPTVIGVHDVLRVVRDGDFLEVDANSGAIRVAERRRQKWPNQLVFPHDQWELPQVVGSKAANLSRAARLGFKVPPFCVLSWDELAQMVDGGQNELENLIEGLTAKLALGALGESEFLLRSSALDEDNVGCSRAGAYMSVRFAGTGRLAASAYDFIQMNAGRDYKGGVILQRFLPATMCGVSIDGDVRIGMGDKLVAEYVQGEVNSATEGRGNLQRMTYDRHSGDVAVESDGGGLLGTLPLPDLIDWLSRAGQTFGRPTYTEWGFCEGDYWLYQIRGGAASGMEQAH